MKRLLAIFAHPDDEVYAAGGTLALEARRGSVVQLVCATRGELGPPPRTRATADPADQQNLGKLRTRELEASCGALGILPPLWLDLPDGALADLDPTVAGARISDLLAEQCSDVVITLGRDGAYGHRDHLAITRLVEAATQRLQPNNRPRLLHAAFPCGLFHPVWRALRKCRNVVDPSINAELLGTTADQVALRVDIRSARHQKLAAIAAHRSQLIDGDPLTFLRPGLVAPLLDEEWFTLAGGTPLPPDAADPFAGLPD